MLSSLSLVLAPSLAVASPPPTDAPRLAVQAVAIAHCTKQPASGGLVPPTLRADLDRALAQRIDRGQLVSRPLLLTRLGTQAKMVTGHRRPDGSDHTRFALTVDSEAVDTGGVQYTVRAEVSGAESEVRFGGAPALGWVMAVPAAELRCRGARQPETLIAVMPEVLDDQTTIAEVAERTRSPTFDVSRRGDLLAELLAELPTWF